MNYETHPAFLDGFLDALDAVARPTTDHTGDRIGRAAWQAGHDRFAELVKRERERIEALVRSAGEPAV